VCGRADVRQIQQQAEHQGVVAAQIGALEQWRANHLPKRT